MNSLNNHLTDQEINEDEIFTINILKKLNASYKNEINNLKRELNNINEVDAHLSYIAESSPSDIKKYIKQLQDRVSDLTPNSSLLPMAIHAAPNNQGACDHVALKTTERMSFSENINLETFCDNYHLLMRLEHEVIRYSTESILDGRNYTNFNKIQIIDQMLNEFRHIIIKHLIE